MALVTHLSSIDISVEDPSALLEFYESTWGLRKIATTESGEILLRAAGAEHHVLTLVPGGDHSLKRIGLGAAGREAVDHLASRLKEAGVPIISGPAERDAILGGGYGITFLDPEGRRIEVAAEAATHREMKETPGPDRLSHIVLNSVNLAASKDFYVDVLGFRVSDYYEHDQMIFLSCNTVHHCIVLAPGEWTSLNHVAFEVESADEVMHSLGRMRKAGFDTIWGPGRHGPGGNVFCYFVDPAGNVIEYTAELLEIGDDWEPQVWARTPENADVWGTSGGITPEVIRAMSNPPAGAAS